MSALAPLIDAYLAGLSRDYGVAVIDARTWVAEDGFFDSHHLLPAGASTFSRRLGCSHQEQIVCLQQAGYINDGRPLSGFAGASPAPRGAFFTASSVGCRRLAGVRGVGGRPWAAQGSAWRRPDRAEGA